MVGAAHDIPASTIIECWRGFDGERAESRTARPHAVQLTDTANHFYLWSDAYDPDLDDLLQSQDETSMGIGSTLRIKLADRLRLAVPQAAPRNFEVHNLYLKPAFSGINGPPKG